MSDQLLDGDDGFAPVTVEEDGHKMVVSHRSATGFGVGTYVNDDGSEEEESIGIFILGLRTADNGEHEYVFQEQEIVEIALKVVEWQIAEAGRERG